MEQSLMVRTKMRPAVLIRATKSRTFALLLSTGALSFLGYVLFFLLMHSHAIWQSPTLVQDRWKQFLYPINNLFPQVWIRPPVWSEMRLAAAGMFVLLVLALFVIYIYALRRTALPGVITAADSRLAFRTIIAVTILILLLLLVIPGVLSTDLFSYVWYGRIFGVFGGNPFVQVPADYAWHDPGNWLQWVFWKETPSAYGPAWVLIAGVVARIAEAFGGDIVNHVLGYKILADLSHLANTVLVWKVSGILIARHWKRPNVLPEGVTEADWVVGARVTATLAYAWNPLLILEFGVSGHNDVLMLTAVLAALWLHLTGRWRWAVAALAVGMLVKLNTLLFIPGYVWLLFWEAAPGGLRENLARRLLVVCQSLLILLATSALFYAPFWAGPATLKPIVSGPVAALYANSIGFLIRFKLPDVLAEGARALGLQPNDFWTSPAIGERLEWPSRWGPTLLFLVFALMQTWKARTFPRMLAAWGWVTFVYLAVGGVWFWPWYVAWLLVVAVLVGPGRLFKATQIFAASSLILYATFWRGDAMFAEWASWRPLLLVGPPIVYAVASWLMAHRHTANLHAIRAGQPHRIELVPVAFEQRLPKMKE